MAYDEVPNGCCWWNRLYQLCCTSEDPYQLRKDDCMFQLSHKLAGIYKNGRFSRGIWKAFEQRYDKNSNRDKDVKFTDVDIITDMVGGKVGRFQVRIFQPRCANCDHESCNECQTVKLPVLMYLHGGGFTTFSAKFQGYHELCIKYAKEGFVVMSVSYRLAPENPFPAAVVDCYSAMRWIFDKEHPEIPVRADPTKGFVIMGDSSGGNLALCLATLVRDGLNPNLRAAKTDAYSIVITKLVLTYPVLYAMSHDLQENARLQREFVELARRKEYRFLSYPIFEGYNRSYLGKHKLRRKNLEVTDRRVSPVLAGLHDLPPTLIIAAGDDFLALPSRILETKMLDEGTPVEIETYDDQPHGFFVLSYLDAAEAAFQRCLRFVTAEAKQAR